MTSSSSGHLFSSDGGHYHGRRENSNGEQMDPVSILSDINEISSALNEMSQDVERGRSGRQYRESPQDNSIRMWNSLNISHQHGTPLKSRPRSSEPLKIDEFLARSSSSNSSSRRRRVQFAEQLEDDSKPVFSGNTPKTKSILKGQKRGLPRVDTRSSIDEYSKENSFSARDPTPCSSKKKLDAPASKSFDDEPQMLQFSPSERHSSRANQTSSSIEIERNTTSTPVNRRVERRSQDWNVADIFSPPTSASKKSHKAVLPTRPVIDTASAEKGSLTIGALKLSPGPDAIEVSTLPSQGDWTVTLPSKPVLPSLANHDVVNQFDDTWRVLAPSPSESSEESATAYLIQKYANKNKTVAPSERGRQRQDDDYQRENADSMLLSPKLRTSSQSPEKSPRFQKKSRKKAAQSQENTAAKQQKRKDVGYSVLEEDQDSFLEETGTELVWMRDGVPDQISLHYGDTDMEESPVFRTKRSIIREFLGRRPAETPKTPVNEIDLDAKALHVNSTGSETDESGNGIEVSDGRGSGWNNSFDEVSVKTGDDYDQLLPIRGLASRKKRCIIRSVIALALLGAVVGIGVYLTMTLPGKKFDVSKSACAKGGTDFSYSQRYIDIRDIILMADSTDGFLVDTAQTVQRKALCWVADYDGLEIDSDSSNSAAIIQRYTMGVIYFSLAKQSSEGLSQTNFLSAEHECVWDNVLCGISTSVTALLLANMNLEGMLPREIGHLTRLTFLEAGLNSLTGEIPTSLERLTLLEYFGASFNQLTGTLPTELGSMTSLEFLNLRSSRLIGTIPTEIGKLTVLQTLLLEGNFLSGSIPTQLGQLFNVEQMAFQNNYLIGSISAEICELRKASKLRELAVDKWVECVCCS